MRAAYRMVASVAAVIALTACEAGAQAAKGPADEAAAAGTQASGEAGRAAVLAEISAAVEATELEGAPPYDSEHLRAQRTAGGWCIADWATQTPATDPAVNAVVADLVTHGWKAGSWQPKGVERVSFLTKGEWGLQVVHRGTAGDEYLSFVASRDSATCPALAPQSF